MNSNKQDNGINLLELFFYLLSKWYWFVLSVSVFLSIAWYNYSKIPYEYYRSATVIIKDPSNTTSSAGFDRYNNYINKVNVANEILQFRSKKLMREVVKRLDANIYYQYKERLRDVELYSKTPIKVDFIDLPANKYASLCLFATGMQTYRITNIMDKEDLEIEAGFNDTISTDIGRIVVKPTLYFNSFWYKRDLFVTKYSIDNAASYFLSNLGIQQEEDEASILSISMKDNSIQRADEVLDMLITVYNEDAINDKNQVAVNTANFIKERLIIIESELGSVESSLENFKKSNQLVSIESTAGMYMSQSQQYNSSVLQLETEIRLAKYIKEYLTDSDIIDLIPSNTGLNDVNVEAQINTYNTTKLRLDKLKVDSSESNPVVQELSNSLRSMRLNIIRAIDNLITSLDLKKTDAESREKFAQARVATVPTKEREMLTIERQQKIKESLYMFLLNKREENALSQAMADNNARLIDEADGSSNPISPNRKKILMLGLLLGLITPAGYFLITMFLDNKVSSRKDLEDVISMPFIGDIPEEKDANIKGVFSKEEYSTISEAFRILRTNLSFMINKKEKCQAITFTSFSEGAGKTFISRNLAISYVLANKKVAIIDLDIRKGTLSKSLLGKTTGVTNYLSDDTVTIDDIIYKDEDYDMMDIVPAGMIAPNPAELLMGDRLDKLIAEMKERYDILIVDNVPIGIVADAAIANRIADLTVFVVRAGKFDKRQIPDLEKMYTEKRLNNLSLILNGIDTSKKGYGYGYGYGYGSYGYGAYGYGYGYNSNKKKKSLIPFIK